MDFKELSAKLAEGVDLSMAEAVGAADLLASGEPSVEDKVEFLLALSTKGESAQEVAGLAQRFRELARNPGLEKWQADAIDVCGTGGDKVGSFNISTTVTFVMAAAGVPVFKHGNRSITSKCGSANLLEALGVKLDADDALLARSIEELGFCFMFAPAFHPAFKEIMPARQALAAKGQRTVFNLIGPLINPARPACQLVGVFSQDYVALMAGSLKALGLEASLAVHCSLPDGRGMDELSTAGDNCLHGEGRLAGLDGVWSPAELGIEAADVGSLLGGDLEENLNLLDELLAGRAPKGLEDTVCLNAGAALHVAGKASGFAEGIEQGRDLLLGGAVARKLADTKEFFESA